MSLWERPRGPGKGQAGCGSPAPVPGRPAIAIGEPREGGREARESPEGRAEGKFAEEEPPLGSDRPAAEPPRRDGDGVFWGGAISERLRASRPRGTTGGEEPQGDAEEPGGVRGTPASPPSIPLHPPL